MAIEGEAQHLSDVDAEQSAEAATYDALQHALSHGNDGWLYTVFSPNEDISTVNRRVLAVEPLLEREFLRRDPKDRERVFATAEGHAWYMKAYEARVNAAIHDTEQG